MNATKKNPNLGKHEAWKGRAVIWSAAGGLHHVAVHAATLGRGVVSKLACGGGSTNWIKTNTWYGVKNDGGRVCRKCSAWLAAHP